MQKGNYFYCRFFLLLSCVLLPNANAENAAPTVQWERTLSQSTFAKAKSAKRFVLLDLEALWCHWCHVMDDKTYRRPDVTNLISKHFIAVRVDQDARPDLSNRYRDFGWPATIIFNSEGQELRKLAGYVEPEEMKRVLEAVIENPTPLIEDKVSFAEHLNLSAELRMELQRRYKDAWDRKVGGLRTSHKFLDADTIEFGLRQISRGNSEDEHVLRLSLANNLKLFDSVWGGVYQYSTHGDWQKPHYERIAEKQADNLRLYAMAATVWPGADYEVPVRNVARYLEGFLQSPDGAFYTSQDADLIKGVHSEEYYLLSDSERRKKGIPSIDKNIYTSENGRIIFALCAAFSGTGDAKFLSQALRAASWIVEKRRMQSGGYAHGDRLPGDRLEEGPYLVDSLHFGRATLALYSVTGDRKWLSRAEEAATFILQTFAHAGEMPGFLPAQNGLSGLVEKPVLSENIVATRFFNLLAAYSGKNEFRLGAERAMRLLATKDVVTQTITEVGVLLADEELNNPPLHLTVVGNKNDATAKALFHAAIRYPEFYKRTEWWDKREGPMPNPDVQYPTLPKAAAFVCTNKRCSLPVFAPEKIAATVKALQQ